MYKDGSTTLGTLDENFKYRIIEPSYCNFSKTVTTLKSKPVEIKINLLRGSIN